MQNILTSIPFDHFEDEHMEIQLGDEAYPGALARMKNPPERLFVVGDPQVLADGIAITGARKATPYGLDCAQKFAALTAEQGITLFSGGAHGIGAAAIETALERGGKVAVFLGSGLAKSTAYPQEHAELFQRIIDKGGALVSPVTWSHPARPHLFRERNLMMASLAKAALVVEAAIPSGTFSTADHALAAGREVLAVPGNIDSLASKGSNLLIALGAVPIVDESSYLDALSRLFR